MTQQYKLARRRKHFNVQRRGLSAEMIMTINHKLLIQAQQKARAARQNGDGAKWMEANEEMKKAAGMPWYRGNVAGGAQYGMD